MLISGTRNISIEIGDWVVIPSEHFHSTCKFVFDRLSVPFAILTLCWSARSARSPAATCTASPAIGRFFLLYARLPARDDRGLAGRHDRDLVPRLGAGRALVGPARGVLPRAGGAGLNGQRVWSVYRVSDAAFLLAAVALHHLTGEGDFAGLMGSGALAGRRSGALTPNQALGVGLLLLVAAAGKSALIPFSGWLPRAMEGPTPSSAVFYGALSVHLGAFLLLRVSPILELSTWLCAAVVVLGLAIGGLRGDRRPGADGREERPGVRLADAGRDHHGRDRPGLALHRR